MKESNRLPRRLRLHHKGMPHETHFGCTEELASEAAIGVISAPLSHPEVLGSKDRNVPREGLIKMA
jgi:hypothetical protein